MIRGQGLQKLIVLAASSAAVNAPSSDTNENILATITIPANLMGLNGQVDIVSFWTMTNSVNNKTFNTRIGGIGGTIMGANIFTTQTIFRDHVIISNRGAANSQVSSKSNAQEGNNAGSIGPLGGTNAFQTAVIDTTAATTIVLTATKATGTETVTLESYRAVLILP